MTRSVLEIVGAGPAGLSAAITAARGGARVIVYERARQPGSRFHGDFQGLENWTTPGDVLGELSEVGVEARFVHDPVHRLVVWEPGGREHIFESDAPFFYLVRRGPQQGTLDTSLALQAAAAGVEIRWGEALGRLPKGGIVAGGPRGAEVVAVGYVFETDLEDGCYAAMGKSVAPQRHALTGNVRRSKAVGDCAPQAPVRPRAELPEGKP